MVDRVLWMCIADARRAKLVHGAAVPRNRYRFELRDTYDNPEEAHEHGRPSPRRQKDGHSYASRTHEERELLSRWAHELVEWLEKRAEEHDVWRLALFAPPRLLGALRDAYTPALQDRIAVEEEANLSHVGLGDLTKHPAVAPLIEIGGERS